MSNRFQVIEAIISGDKPRIRPLNAHPNFNQIFWYGRYQPQGQRSKVTGDGDLFVFDVKLQLLYSWHECGEMALCENLKRIQLHKAPKPPESVELLRHHKYIDADGDITPKGHLFVEHIDQLLLKVPAIPPLSWRFLVLETWVKDEQIEITPLSSHERWSTIFGTFPRQELNEQLSIIDMQQQIIYDWQGCVNMIYVENTRRVQNGLRPFTTAIYSAMREDGLLDSAGILTTKAHEHLAEFERRVINISLGKIRSTSTAHSIN